MNCPICQQSIDEIIPNEKGVRDCCCHARILVEDNVITAYHYTIQYKGYFYQFSIIPDLCGEPDFTLYSIDKMAEVFSSTSIPQLSPQNALDKLKVYLTFS